MSIVGQDSQNRGRGGSKPGERRGGRQKGTPNRMTKQVREMILEALDQAGGVDYLARQAETSPTAFLSLVGKVLPLQMKSDDDEPLRVIIRRFDCEDDN